MVETLRIKLMREEELTKKQLELIVGSLLGDAYLVKTTKGYAFRVNHGLLQREYVDWKYSFLSNLVNTPPKSSGKCYYFRTVTHPAFSELRQRFYPYGKKVLPVRFVAKHFSAFVLAVWVMDDGTKCGNQVRINSHCFSESENRILQEILSAKLGIKSVINKDKDRLRLRIVQESISLLKRLIRPFMIPSMLYKLPP